MKRYVGHAGWRSQAPQTMEGVVHINRTRYFIRRLARRGRALVRRDVYQQVVRGKHRGLGMVGDVQEQLGADVAGLIVEENLAGRGGDVRYDGFGTRGGDSDHLAGDGIVGAHNASNGNDGDTVAHRLSSRGAGNATTDVDLAGLADEHRGGRVGERDGRARRVRGLWNWNDVTETAEDWPVGSIPAPGTSGIGCGVAGGARHGDADADGRVNRRRRGLEPEVAIGREASSRNAGRSCLTCSDDASCADRGNGRVRSTPRDRRIGERQPGRVLDRGRDGLRRAALEERERIATRRGSEGDRCHWTSGKSEGSAGSARGRGEERGLAWGLGRDPRLVEEKAVSGSRERDHGSVLRVPGNGADGRGNVGAIIGSDHLIVGKALGSELRGGGKTRDWLGRTRITENRRVNRTDLEPLDMLVHKNGKGRAGSPFR